MPVWRAAVRRVFGFTVLRRARVSMVAVLRRAMVSVVAVLPVGVMTPVRRPVVVTAGDLDEDDMGCAMGFVEKSSNNTFEVAALF
jgi:hypothetical protein